MKAPRGTFDILPDRIGRWRRLETVVRGLCARYGYEEIRTPSFEETSLFKRAVGDTTDIVEKQMFTFPTGGETEEEFLTLRPEITAPVIRAMIEHNLLKQRGFWKLFYIGPAFRKERPQKGRFRQFHQFGIEAVGSADPLLDAETIFLFADILRGLGIATFEVRLGTIGCRECRKPFRDAVRDAAKSDEARLCANCRNRLDRNVLRIFDCKEERCREIASGLPKIREFLCRPCRDHDEALKAALGDRVPVRTDDTLVRGLDYYTRTVYEFTSPDLGAQDALGGGGRYDNLVRELGWSEDVPAIGFAAGIERILLAMDAAAPKEDAAARMDFYGVAVKPDQRETVFGIVDGLRRQGLSGTMDFEGRSLKAQMRSANKLGARFAVIVGEDESRRQTVRLKDLRSKDDSSREQEVKIDELAQKLGA